jgi:hypothetical protein
MRLGIRIARETEMKGFTVGNSVLLVCATLLSAQARAQLDFGVGPIVGMNFSNLFHPSFVTPSAQIALLIRPCFYSIFL